MTRINVGIFDEIRKGNKARPMGSAMFEVGETLGSRGNVKAKRLKKGGTLFLHAVTAPSEDAGILDLTLKGHKLKNVEGMFSKSDPFFEISAKINAAGGLTWQPVYRSKHIASNLNPEWETATISVNRLCPGNLDAPILIAVFDWEKSGKHRSMGSFETTVNALLKSVVPGGKSGDMTKTYTLMKDGKSFGDIVVAGAYIEGGPDPSLSKYGKYTNPNPQPTPASAGGIPSKFIKVNGISKLNPEWKKWKESQENGGRNGDAASAASAPAAAAASAPTSFASQTASALVEQSPPRPPTQNAQNSSNSMPSFGNLPVAVAPPLMPPTTNPARRPKFVDYLMGGCELQLAVAIDFTGSNGDPRKPGTLHYIHRDDQLNQYEKALTAVGSVLARYDSDQMFPVWGFGAKFGGVIQHCFQVGPSAEVSGVSGILEGYRQVFRTGLTMSGPTVFAEVIALAAAQARAKQEYNAKIGKQAYCILLILTDGAVTDKQQTKQALINASDAPLSIVIVGIGNADFSDMKFLDDFQSQEGGMGRDICQFVEFSRHENNRQSLTRETLDEIPDQLVDYFFSRGIVPLPPLTGSKFSVAESDFDDKEDVELDYDFGTSSPKLVSVEGTVFDDTKYDTYHKYSKVQPMAPPPASSTSTMNSSASSPQRHLPNPRPAPAPAPPSSGGNVQIFNVQVPPNGYPGMQLQIQNPYTGQQMFVEVPPGVKAGDTFAVA